MNFSSLYFNNLFWVGCLIIALFWIVAYFLPFQDLNMIAATINMSLAATVSYAYGRESFNALRSREISRGAVLALGICGSWLAISMTRVFILVWHLNDLDSSWLEHDFVSFIFVLSSMAAALHLTAPYAVHTVPRRSAFLSLAIALAAGGAIGGYIVGAYLH